jgi:hypothetical protein
VSASIIQTAVSNTKLHLELEYRVPSSSQDDIFEELTLADLAPGYTERPFNGEFGCLLRMI